MPELKELSASIKSDSIAENAQGPNIDADKLEDDQIQDAKFINSDEQVGIKRNVVVEGPGPDAKARPEPPVQEGIKEEVKD